MLLSILVTLVYLETIEQFQISSFKFRGLIFDLSWHKNVEGLKKDQVCSQQSINQEQSNKMAPLHNLYIFHSCVWRHHHCR